MNAVEILEKLVSFNIFGGEPNLTIIDWIDSYIQSFGIKTRRVYNEKKTKANVHCRIGPSVDGGFILSGHTDVVPVEGQKWTSDPFVLTDKKDGKLYGRGSCDMKGFIACCLAMLPEFVEAELKRPIYFAFSYDEEIGCIGAPSMVTDFNEFYSEKPKFAIIGEPSEMVPVIGQKGISVMETVVNGSAGHSSRIKQELSAIHEASRLIIWLEEKMDALVKSGHIDERFTPPHTSIHIGMISGGVATNIIADNCSFSWDIRIIPKDSVNEILDEFSRFCREREALLQKIFADFKIETSMHNPLVPPLDTSVDSDILAIVQRLTNRTEWSAVSYAAEAGQFSAGGFESIICGPGSIEQAHRANEFVEKEQLDLAIEMLKSLIIHLEE